MARRARRSRIASFKTPFLASVLGSSAVLSGCGGQTEEACNNCNVQNTLKACPERAPVAGADCDGFEIGKVCGDGDAGVPVACSEQGKWEEHGRAAETSPSGSQPTKPDNSETDGTTPDNTAPNATDCPICDPSAPPPSSECPLEVPIFGEPCSGFESGLACDFAAGSCTQSALCDPAMRIWVDRSPSCNPPFVEVEPVTECPVVVPDYGTSCVGFQVGLVCGDPDSCSGIPYVRCEESGSWEDAGQATCNPPPPELEHCPDAVPILGASCYGYAPDLQCEYADGYCPEIVTCDAVSSTWMAVEIECNPPPVEPEPLPNQDAGTALPDSDGDAGAAETVDAGTDPG